MVFNMKVEILRLGHRKLRDARITTHVALTGRAFGATRMIFCGEEDPTIKRSLAKVCDNWGGSFEVAYRSDWQHYLKSYPGLKIHLTMYGIPFQEAIEEIQGQSNESGVLVVVGSEKVPGMVYELVDYNLSVTNQPHSEIGALAIFLDNLLDVEKLGPRFPGGKRRIIPHPRGKRVLKLDEEPTSSDVVR